METIGVVKCRDLKEKVVNDMIRNDNEYKSVVGTSQL